VAWRVVGQPVGSQRLVPGNQPLRQSCRVLGRPEPQRLPETQSGGYRVSLLSRPSQRV